MTGKIRSFGRHSSSDKTKTAANVKRKRKKDLRVARRALVQTKMLLFFFFWQKLKFAVGATLPRLHCCTSTGLRLASHQSALTLVALIALRKLYATAFTAQHKKVFRIAILIRRNFEYDSSTDKSKQQKNCACGNTDFLKNCNVIIFFSYQNVFVTYIRAAPVPLGQWPSNGPPLTLWGGRRHFQIHKVPL